MKKISTNRYEVIVDLPIINQNGQSFNVEYKGKNVYVDRMALGSDRICDMRLIVLESDSMETPVYRGGFTEVYVKKDGQPLSDILDRYL